MWSHIRQGRHVGAHKLLIDFLGNSLSFAPSSGASGRVGSSASISGFPRDGAHRLEAIDRCPTARRRWRLPDEVRAPHHTRGRGRVRRGAGLGDRDHCKPAKTVTMYDPWTTSSVVQFAKASDRTRAVLHEIGTPST